MKKAYRMFRRGQFYYIQKNGSNYQRSLGTTDRKEAKELLEAENKASQSARLNLDVGLAYLRHANPKLATRVWQEAMDELSSHGKEVSQQRCKREMNSKSFDLIRNKVIVGTTAE